MKRHLAGTLIIAAGIGLTGCQAPSLGGLAFWNRNGSSATASTAPDVGKQKYSGLASQFGGGDPHRPMGQASAGSTALGQARPSEEQNFFAASWKKTTAAVTGASTAVTGAFAARPKIAAAEDDPVRLDNMPKKIGPDVYVSVARLLENQGKFAEAEEKYREALRAEPADLNALVGIARLYDRQGQSAKAIETYFKAAQAHPNEALVHNDLGLCFRRQHELDKSIVAMQKAVQLAPENAKYHNNLAAVLVDAGRNDEALRELTALNTTAVAHYNLAQLLEQKSERGLAVQHLQQAVALDPSLIPARDMLAQLNGSAAAAVASLPAARQSATSAFAVGPAAPTGSNSVAEVAEAPSYHVGDDSGPAASLAQRPDYSGSASRASGIRSLPPIE